MKIIVDKLPTTPKECLFAKRNVERGYICPLQHCSCSIELGLSECPCLRVENFCEDCFWYSSEQEYCGRFGCHTYNATTCDYWEPKANAEV